MKSIITDFFVIDPIQHESTDIKYDFYMEDDIPTELKIKYLDKDGCIKEIISSEIDLSKQLISIDDTWITHYRDIKKYTPKKAIDLMEKLLLSSFESCKHHVVYSLKDLYTYAKWFFKKLNHKNDRIHMLMMNRKTYEKCLNQIKDVASLHSEVLYDMERRVIIYDDFPSNKIGITYEPNFTGCIGIIPDSFSSKSPHQVKSIVIFTMTDYMLTFHLND